MTDETMPIALADWRRFSAEMERHIMEYTIPQYGDFDTNPARDYNASDCVKHAERYCARFGKSNRVGEEIRDMLKAAHYIQMAANRIGLPEDDTGIPSPELVAYRERNYSEVPENIATIKATKNRDGKEWSPRDAIIDALRDIDSGTINPVCCIVMMGEAAAEGVTRYTQCSSGVYELLGLIERAKISVTRTILGKADF